MPLPRPIKNSLLPLLLVFAAQKICAQLAPADDFFNGGAQLYISNNIPAALEKTENGLKLYPTDEKLKKLEELLKKQQQSQSQQNQKNQQSQNSESQRQQKNQNSSQSQSQQNQQSQNQQNEKQNSQQQQSHSAQEKSGEEKNGQPPNEQAMTPQEAKRLLDAQKSDEQFLQLKPQNKPQDNQQPVKDW